MKKWNWKQIATNVGGAFLAGFSVAYGIDRDPKTAAAAGLAAVIANLFGLTQDPPQKPERKAIE